MKRAAIAFFSGQVPQRSEYHRRLLGVEPIASSEKMTIFFLNETKIFLHYRYLTPDGELPPEDPHAFLVDDADAACLQRVEQGLTVEIPTQDSYWCRPAYVRVPDGRQIEITQKGN